MNQDIIKGHWNEVKGKLKQQWGELTDDDIKKMEGTYDELHGILQKKCGYEKDKAKKELDIFIKRQGWDDQEH